MASQYRHRRTSSPSTPFPGLLEPGEIAVNTANRQLALGDADGANIGAPLPLLTIRYFDARAQYAINDYVMQNGIVYRANAAVPPGAFNASNWTVIANPGTFVLKAGDTMTGHLALPTNPAAANAVRKDYVDAADTTLTTNKVAKAGDTMTGFLTLHADPDAPLKAATKQYVDAKPVLAVSDTPPGTPADNLLWWDSDTGTLYVRYNDGAGTPQWVQAVAMPAIDTAAFVQKTGDTMAGHLSLPASPAAANAVRKDYVDAKADAPVDEKSYARRGALWAEVPRYERVSIAGGKSFDVQVPAGATAARVTGIIKPTTATGISPIIQLSVAAGVFRSATGEYFLYGYQHSTISNPAAVVANNGTTTIPGMMICAAHAHATLTMMVDGFITLARPTTAYGFDGEFRSGGSYNANGMCHTFYYNFLHPSVLGSALNVLAFRLLSSTGDNWAAGSTLSVEWL